MKYNAFISYRHAPLDIKMAKKIHQGLETYKIPVSVRKKVGMKKIQRVFRDQEELPIGSSLTDNISAALESSDWLIVICSPRTPDSYWVQKEIDTFIQMHGRHRVLAVLIEGEPNESFPAKLLTDENGTPVEPLAADMRGETDRERNKKFKTEIIRLVASVIGCSYDDLRQRHRERKIRRIISIAGSAAAIIAAAGTAFGVYNHNVAVQMTELATEKSQLAEEKSQLADEKTLLADKIAKEYEAKQQNQSRFLATEALQLLGSGEREDAALVAKAALPSDTDQRPYVADAEYALSKVLHVYDVGETVQFDRTLSHDLVPSEEVLSHDRKYLTTRDSGHNVYVWDTSDWHLIVKILPSVNDRNYLEDVSNADADDNGVYICAEKAFTKYDHEGNVLYTYTSDHYLQQGVICTARDEAYLVSDDGIETIGLTSGAFKSFYESEAVGFYSDCRMTRDDNYLLLKCYDRETDRCDVACYSPETESLTIARTSMDYVTDYCYTHEGSVAVLGTNKDFILDGIEGFRLDIADPATGANKGSAQIPVTVHNVATFSSEINSHSYDADDVHKAEIVITIEGNAYTYNEYNASLVTTLTLPGEAVTLDLRSDNSIGFVGYANGNIDTIDFAEGRIYPDNGISTDCSIRDICILDGKLAIRAAYTSSIYVMKYHTAPDLEEVGKFGSVSYVIGAPGDEDYFIVNASREYSFVDSDNETFFSFDTGDEYPDVRGFLDGKFVAVGSKHIFIADAAKKEMHQLSMEDFGLDTYLSHSYLTANGRYAALWSYRDFAIVDLAEEKLLLSGSCDTSIGCMVVSEDGEEFLYQATDNNLTRVDIASREETPIRDDALRNVSDCYSLQYIAMSSDKNYAAICCGDGNLRIVGLKNGQVMDTIPLYTRLRCNLIFTPDNKHLIIQGDDFRIRILDLETHTIISSFDATYEIRDYVFDEDGYIALYDVVGVYLMETENYGVCAYAEGAMTFIPSTKTFISRSGSRLYRTAYKDYHYLLEEVERQFPGAELTEEEKVKYNLN